MKETFITRIGECSQETCCPKETGCNIEGEYDPCDCKYFKESK